MASNYPVKCRGIIENNSNDYIKTIFVCKREVWPILYHALNLSSLGNLKRKMQLMGYDKLYHTYLILILSNNKIILISKNGFIEMRELDTFPSLKIDGDLVSFSDDYNFIRKIDVNSRIRFIDFLENSRRIEQDRFFDYHHIKNNCQLFVKKLFHYNNIFINQDHYLQDIGGLLHGYWQNKVIHVMNIVDNFIRN